MKYVQGIIRKLQEELIPYVQLKTSEKSAFLIRRCGSIASPLECIVEEHFPKQMKY